MTRDAQVGWTAGTGNGRDDCGSKFDTRLRHAAVVETGRVACWERAWRGAKGGWGDGGMV